MQTYASSAILLASNFCLKKHLDFVCEDFATYIQDFNGVKIATRKEGDCRKKAAQGDSLFVTHIGAFPGEDGQMVQFDGNGDGETLVAKAPLKKHQR
jgi:hypothetical protein